MTPTTSRYVPRQPAANQFWMQGQTAPTNQDQPNTRLLVTVASIGSVLLLALIGGTIFLALSGGNNDSSDAEPDKDQQVAASEPRSPAKEEPRSSVPSTHPHDDLKPSQAREVVSNEQPDNTQSIPDSTPGQTAEQEYPSQSTPSDPVPAPRPQPAGRDQSDVSIRLSRGVALPQTLPMGTAIGFSATYEFTSGSPRTSSKYLWVISNRQGQTAPLSVQLNREGQLNAFIGWQKYQAPFVCHIEEVTPQGNRRAISDRLTFH